MAGVDAACKTAGFGKLMPTALYVHAESLHRLPGVLRVYEGCARVLTGEVEGTTILKLRRHEPKISYLAYPAFETDAHPALVRSLRGHPPVGAVLLRACRYVAAAFAAVHVSDPATASRKSPA
jgi:DNA phosphorothioation-associated putative methyltransferase